MTKNGTSVSLKLQRSSLAVNFGACLLSSFYKTIPWTLRLCSCAISTTYATTANTGCASGIAYMIRPSTRSAASHCKNSKRCWNVLESPLPTSICQLLCIGLRTFMVSRVSSPKRKTMTHASRSSGIPQKNVAIKDEEK
jgi:hypothetical protein